MELNVEYSRMQTIVDGGNTFERFFGNLEMPGIVKRTAERFIREFSR